MESKKQITLDNCITPSLYSIRSMLQGHDLTRKRQKTSHAVPVLTGLLQFDPHQSKGHRIVILFDSGASQSIVQHKIVRMNTLIRQTNTTKWTTFAGKFLTKYETEIVFTLPLLHETKEIKTMMHVAPSIANYDMIIDRDLLHDLGIVLDFSNHTIAWDHAIAPMTNYIDG